MSGETRFIHTEASKALRLKRVTLIAVTRLGTAKELPNAQKYNAPRYCRVGLTFGYGRALMHGVAPRMCGQISQSTVRRRSRGSLPRRPLTALREKVARSVTSEHRLPPSWSAEETPVLHRHGPRRASASVCLLRG